MNDISYLSGVGQPEDLKDANLLVEVKSTAQKMDNLDIEILTVPEKKTKFDILCITGHHSFGGPPHFRQSPNGWLK